jgi:hypothetical protein
MKTFNAPVLKLLCIGLLLASTGFAGSPGAPARQPVPPSPDGEMISVIVTLREQVDLTRLARLDRAERLRDLVQGPAAAG